MSKLCCPVCWELLRTLNQDGRHNLIARGCHSTIYPVALPEWIPDHVHQDMVRKFRVYLCAELAKLTVTQPLLLGESAKDHYPGQESDGDLSASSSAGAASAVAFNKDYYLHTIA